MKTAVFGPVGVALCGTTGRYATGSAPLPPPEEIGGHGLQAQVVERPAEDGEDLGSTPRVSTHDICPSSPMVEATRSGRGGSRFESGEGYGALAQRQRHRHEVPDSEGSNPSGATTGRVLSMPMRASTTTEELRTAVAESRSYAEVIRKLGLRPGGGTQSHLKIRIVRNEIDISHFSGQAWAKNTVGRRRNSPESIFVLLPEGSYRPHGYMLRRALLETGETYACRECGISEWGGEPLVLDVDHIDGNWLNNLRMNLQFLCPNCHSQKT